MPPSSADVVICGAGIAGIAAAYFLTVHQGIADVVLIDERPPLSLTSDKSTECYRNWWPGPGDAMVRFMNRSIDLLESLADESDNVFGMNRRGYLYATADPAQIEVFERAAAESAELGSGPLRIYRGAADDPVYQPAPAHGWKDQPTGADLLVDQALIQQHFPYLAPDTRAVLHARRCGWLSAQQLGMYLWDRARAAGARLVTGRLTEISVEQGRVTAAQVHHGTQATSIATRHFVNAAGPFVNDVGRMLGVELPIFSEPHLKIAIEDQLGVVPRDAPLLVWADPTRLVWDDDEREALAESPETQAWLEPFPPGVHARPEGGGASPIVLILWSYHAEPTPPRLPIPVDPEYPELALRGMARMLPGLQRYLQRPPRPYVDGGYYTKTRENRPLIGPLPVAGAYVIGALSGYGIMAACAAGELLAAHVADATLPPYALDFGIARYDDPAYQARLHDWPDTGQL